MIAKIDNKKFYSENIQKKNIPIFFQPWWLDIVAPNSWDILISTSKNNDIIAVMPFVFDKQNKLIMPNFTPFLGPIFWHTSEKYASIISDEINIHIEFIEQFNDFKSFEQKWHYSIKNWLPWYWNKYNQTTKYTYVLNNISNHELIWEGFRDNIRREIRKAEKIVTIESNNDFELFFETLNKTFIRQGLNIANKKTVLNNIFNECNKRDCGKSFFAKDKDNNIHAVILVIWDTNSAYYLIGGGDEKLRTSGATSLLMWEAIKYSSKHVNTFDFEGSMIQPIERFFRAFGAEQKPYFEITKTNSKTLFIKQEIKRIFNYIIKK